MDEENGRHVEVTRDMLNHQRCIDWYISTAETYRCQRRKGGEQGMGESGTQEDIAREERQGAQQQLEPLQPPRIQWKPCGWAAVRRYGDGILELKETVNEMAVLERVRQ